MSKRFLLCFVLLSTGVLIFGQSNPYPEVTISSPTAASLGKYGDVPISYHTGTPEINIPFYTIKEGPLSLPISLSYHTGGIKLMEPSSWVGLGWSLDAGGVITRTVQGAPDEKGTGNLSGNSYGEFSDYGYNNYLYRDDGTAQDWANFANGSKDGQPDLFFFNFGGYSGKFYFNDDRTPVFVPQQDFKVNYTYIGGYSIQNFTITTPDGTKYLFGNTSATPNDSAVEITNSWTLSSGVTPGSVVSSWYLKKIQTADGNFSINLQYAKENYGYFTIGTHPIEPDHITSIPGHPTFSDSGFYLTKNIVTGVRLNKITFSNGEVDFTGTTNRTDLSDNAASMVEAVNANSKELDAIKVVDSFGAFCKQYNFTYDYFNDAATPLPGSFSVEGFQLTTDQKRLRLKNVQEISCDATNSVAPYSFTYSATNLPRRISFGQDFWGFSNGQTGNTSLIPTYTKQDASSFTIHTLADRSPNASTMDGDNLTQITYPTGGSTIFTYEPNSVYSSNGHLDSTTTFLFTNEYGQSRTKDSATFSILGKTQTPAIKVKCTTQSGWIDTLLFTTHPSSGSEVLVYKYTYPDNYTGTISPPLQLSPGDYEVTLSSPSIDQGCEVSFTYNYDTVITYQNVVVGGLRIKTITEKSATGSPDIVTNYSYVSGSNSTGVLYDIPSFTQLVRSDFIEQYGYYTSVNGYHKDWITASGCTTFPDPDYYVSPGNLRPMSTFQGGLIGYQQVQVSQTGNGYSVYHYFINNEGNYILKPTGSIANVNADVTSCNTDIPSFPAAPVPFDPRRGQLSYEEHYDNSGFLLKHIDYLPFYDNTSIPPTPVFIASSIYNGKTILGTFDSIRTVHEDSVVTIETDYPKTGGSITTQKTKYFGSFYHNQVTEELSFNSKGDSLVNIYQYAFDFRITGCDTATSLSDFLAAKSACQVSYNSMAAGCSDDACVTHADTIFFRCENNARINYVNRQIADVSKYQSCHNSAKSAANTDLNPILEMQDDYMNEPIEVSSWKNSTLLSAQFNKYQVVSGTAYINAVQKINLSAPSTSFTNAAVNGSGLTKDGRYENETTVNFTAGNLSDITGRDGVTNSYLWGYKNNLPIAKAINAASNEIYFTSFEEGGWDANLAYNSTHVHSGRTAGYINNTTTSEIYSYSNTRCTFAAPLTATKKYHYSGWIYSAGPDIEIFLMMTTTVGGSYTTFDHVHIPPGMTNKWVLVEKDADVPAGIRQIWLRVDNNQTGQVWYDDMRLYPADAQLSTYTYLPTLGMSSQSDINNRISYYDFDSLGRLKDAKDQDGNILKTFDYHYK